jgi:hypothetical protein
MAMSVVGQKETLGATRLMSVPGGKAEVSNDASHLMSTRAARAGALGTQAVLLMTPVTALDASGMAGGGIGAAGCQSLLDQSQGCAGVNLERSPRGVVDSGG